MYANTNHHMHDSMITIIVDMSFFIAVFKQSHQHTAHKGFKTGLTAMIHIVLALLVCMLSSHIYKHTAR